MDKKKLIIEELKWGNIYYCDHPKQGYPFTKVANKILELLTPTQSVDVGKMFDYLPIQVAFDQLITALNGKLLNIGADYETISSVTKLMVEFQQMLEPYLQPQTQSVSREDLEVIRAVNERQIKYPSTEVYSKGEVDDAVSNFELGWVSHRLLVRKTIDKLSKSNKVDTKNQSRNAVIDEVLEIVCSGIPDLDAHILLDIERYRIVEKIKALKTPELNHDQK
jgi:hypothetical protein